MKKLLLLLTIICYAFMFGQVQEGVKHEPKEIFESVSKEAVFPGGINAFRQKISEIFDVSAVDGKGKISSIITFIVERDGTITDIKATGENKDFNQESVRTISSIKEKWTPAEYNGQKVRYRVSVPISIQFEDEDKNPTFSLGNEAFEKLVFSHIRKNKVNKKKPTECTLLFTVKKDGSLTNIKIDGENKSFNKEVLRAISLIKEKWIPGEKDGEIVDFPYYLDLKFDLK